MQCHRFFDGVTTSEGVVSSWNGHRPTKSLPVLRSSTPCAWTRLTTETLLLEPLYLRLGDPRHAALLAET